MDYEKKYKEAIERARQIHDADRVSGIELTTCEKIFPELAESEDEKIRKALIFNLGDMPEDTELRNGITNRDVLAWLEKQGESYTKRDVDDAYLKGISDAKNELEKQGGKKPADKVEPKFKVGDWIIYSNEEVHLITGFDNNGYFVDKECYIPFNCEGNMRLWTIKDAKDGDVLTNGDFPCIFKRCDGNGSLYVYCGINADNNFSILSEDSENVWDDYSEQYFPATKEQRDTLFAKMKESGYEWLEETKELKKIEQKSAWCENDERHLNTTLAYLKDAKEFKKMAEDSIDWLKSLKQRIGG